MALFSWPAVCLLLFIMLPLEAAAIWSLLGGYLLLPSSMQVDVPLLPPIDKTSISAVTTLLLCWFKGAPPAPRRSLLVYLFGLAYVAAPILTSTQNSYEIQTAAGSIPGFYPLDGIKVAGRNAILLIPFYIGSRFLWSEQARALLLKSLIIAALFYSLPMLVEVRLSPQLHVWVYGYFPHPNFIQMMRGEGFRPVVFLEHGLQVALFASLALIAAIIAFRAKWRVAHAPAMVVIAYLAVLLILCKSLAALLYAILSGPFLFFTRPRTWVKLSCAALLFVCAYPMLRTYSIIPVDHISAIANSISEERASSFNTRVENEKRLLARANEKPLLGWGTWGRNRVYDRDTGKDISVTDGEWIIQFGIFGWFGYLGLFGLLTCAGFRAYRSIGPEVTNATVVLGGLTLLLTVNVVDLLPNGTLSPITLLLAGSITRSARTLMHARSPGDRVEKTDQRLGLATGQTVEPNGLMRDQTRRSDPE